MRLRRKGIGCHLLFLFVACIMYADDICLIAPSRGAMQELLVVCEEFCTEFCLSFNVKKSKSLLFGKYAVGDISPLILNGETIDFVPEWKYLGCVLEAGKTLSFSTKSDLGAFYASSNYLEIRTKTE